MYRRQKRARRCGRWQRKRGRLSCAYYAPRHPTPTNPHRYPANYGATCIKQKLVFGPWHNKKVWRCAKYGHAVRPSTSLWAPKRSSSPLPRLPPGGGQPARLMTPPRRLPPGGASVIPGRIPLSLPSFEKMRAGRTPGRPSARYVSPKQLKLGF
jgi:hypothetical protein